MTNRTTCIYHANCADGFTAAYVVWCALGGKVKYIPAAYGDPLPDVSGQDVILVDFSYKRPQMLALAAAARTVLVLDHHDTAECELAGFPPPFNPIASESLWMAHTDAVAVKAYAGEPACQFDMSRSGAQLAWDFFNPQLPRPQLIEYVADRDLWRFELPDSHAVSAFIGSHDFDFGEWHSLSNMLEDARLRHSAARNGHAIDKAKSKMMRDLIAASRRDMVIGGRVVPVANLPFVMASEGGHLMARDEDFAATYFDQKDGSRKFSLRSQGAINVGEIAEAYGGGGHPRAAGFTMPKGWEGDCPVEEVLEAAGF
jgi:hypothetical protein